ncbi:conjugal transfer protein TraH [Endozoicomonas atrinae]|uniref:conjugal transfer protein TraH n=1 Tax=Endozoicomonas atrinae TaxID=1333660 RepID=UPI000826BB3D|nr:conjugal transfer protein TraH [Endozoicomonas atrinae]
MARKAYKRILSFTIASSVCLFLSIPVEPASASLADEMDGMFNSMSQSTGTAPGAYKSQRRGVFYGGSFTMKSKIVNPNLISVRPPSWKGGCGGVDLFGGSFSFINADQFVQMLRAIAANAKGYAFQLAMDAVCPDCMTQLQSLADKMNELNQYLGNSCQMAQQAVDGVDGFFGVSDKLRTARDKAVAVSSGLLPDSLTAHQQQTGESATEAAARNTTNPLLLADRGNVMWNILQDQGVQNWFASGDDQLMRTMMSLSGSVIVSPPDDATDGTGEKTIPVTPVPGGLLSLGDLVEGRTVNIYTCDNSECTEFGANENVTLQSMQSKIAVGVDKLIAAYTGNTAIDSTDDDIKLIASLGETSTIIHKMTSLTSNESARHLIQRYSSAIALYAAYIVMEDLFYAANHAAMRSQTSYKDDVLKQIESNRKKVHTDYMTLKGKYGDVKDLMDAYNQLIINVRKQNNALNLVDRGKSN